MLDDLSELAGIIGCAKFAMLRWYKMCSISCLNAQHIVTYVSNIVSVSA